MPSFTLDRYPSGYSANGLYGSKTLLETPGPGSYDARPFINPPAMGCSRGRYHPDRSPGFVHVVERGPVVWRPEPFSLSRSQAEQPLVHYAASTFWDFHSHWPKQERRPAGKATNAPPVQRARSNSYSSAQSNGTLSRSASKKLGRRSESAAAGIGLQQA
mmetsp:Transcript_70647/g.169298  ORF Transcript_70647/g.169298 Transcript_70647/m.169298 type:complete len:160 (-) Transcript_70647:108-587(-)